MEIYEKDHDHGHAANRFGTWSLHPTQGGRHSTSPSPDGEIDRASRTFNWAISPEDLRNNLSGLFGVALRRLAVCSRCQDLISVFEKWLRFFPFLATFQVHPRPFLISHELTHHIVERACEACL